MNSKKRSRGPDTGPASSSAQSSPWVVPRGWLILCMILPWIALIAVVVSNLITGRRAAIDSGKPEPPPAAGETVLRPAGRWGQLELAPIVIAPPLEFIPEDPPHSSSAQIFWHFQDFSSDDLEMLLTQAGLDVRRRDEILRTARDDPSIHGVVAAPSRDLVRSLSPSERARIYLVLARCSRNDRQQNAFRFFGSSPEDWFAGAPISEETRALVRPFIYSHDGFLYFADIDLIGDDVQGPEKRRLYKALFRETTLLVKLRVPAGANTDAIAEYWGRGGRRTDIRPLVESVAGISEGYPVDIAHLIPMFARQHLYRYPTVTLAELSKPDFKNCFWTALNFFGDQPDDRFLDLKFVTDSLRRDYYLVHDEFGLGDVVIFSDRSGNPYHAAVYIADGLVFGKNGNSTLSPWITLPLERIKGYYPQHAEDGRIEYYRRKGL